jgi:hypothetical protein
LRPYSNTPRHRAAIRFIEAWRRVIFSRCAIARNTEAS